MADDYAGNDAFAKLYNIYVNDPNVRKVHDPILEAVMSHPAFQRVIDLGCGLENEFFRFAKPAFYVGVDKHTQPLEEPKRVRLVADYDKDTAKIADLIKEHKLTAAVSLFSIENTRPHAQSHAYYENLFRTTGIQALLVTGFYYKNRKTEEKVLEESGLWSYQTTETITHPKTAEFDETRIAVPNPSIFGQDVVDIFRLLQRPAHFNDVAASALSGTAKFNAISTRLANEGPASAAPQPVTVMPKKPPVLDARKSRRKPGR